MLQFELNMAADEGFITLTEVGGVQSRDRKFTERNSAKS